MGKVKHKPGKGRTAKRARASNLNQEEQFAKYPHSFIFNRNSVGKNVTQLIKDMRRVMEPFTATKLKVRKNNTIKDFVSVASLFNVSHLVMFSKTKLGIYMKIGRLPQGPTITFRVAEYSLVKDVISSLKRHHMEANQFLQHPLLVMSNFGEDALNHKLMSSMWQNLFPTIQIQKANVKNFKRCVVLHYNSEDSSIDFRHYNIHIVPTGISKSIKKLDKKKLPSMSSYSDISDYILRAGNLSDSEGEQLGTTDEVILPSTNPKDMAPLLNTNAVRLTEIGPRMKLVLMKINEALNGGQIIYHEHDNKKNSTVHDEQQMNSENESNNALSDDDEQNNDNNIEPSDDEDNGEDGESISNGKGSLKSAVNKKNKKIKSKKINEIKNRSGMNRFKKKKKNR